MTKIEYSWQRFAEPKLGLAREFVKRFVHRDFDLSVNLFLRLDRVNLGHEEQDKMGGVSQIDPLVANASGHKRGAL